MRRILSTLLAALLLPLALPAAAPAAQLLINTGSAANDKTGDPLRTVANKTNANFTELYTTTATLTAALAGKQPLDADLTALAGLSGTGLIYYRAAPDVWSAVQVGAGLSFTGGTLAATGGGSSAWAEITGKPTTLAGYGISDAQPMDADLSAVAALSTAGYGRGLLGAADAAAGRTYLGLGSAALSASSAFDAAGAATAAQSAAIASANATAAAAYVPQTRTVNGIPLSANIIIPSGIYQGQITSLGQAIPAPGTSGRYYTSQVAGTLTDPDTSSAVVQIGGKLIDTGTAWLPENAAATPTVIYLDGVNGSDSASGLSDTTAKKTPAAVVPLVPSGGTIRVCRGSRFFENLEGLANNVTIEAYGSGNRPIWDGGRPISSGAWAAHGSAANVWVATVTLAAPTVYAPPSNQWGIMLWDERPGLRGKEAALTYYVAGADIAANIAYVSANPGTFTAHRVGSTTKDARQTVGTQFTYYVHLADNSDPTTNGRPVYHVDMSQHFVLSRGNIVRDVVFQRAGNKDMVGILYGSPAGGAPGVCERVDFLEPSAHAIVGGGIEFRDCLAVGGTWTLPYSGAGFHNYRDTALSGTSSGFLCTNSRADGFATGFYSHGSGGGVPDHYSYDLRNCTAENCYIGVSTGAVVTSVALDRMKMINCGTGVEIGGVGTPLKLTNSSYLSSTAGTTGFVTSNGSNVTVDNCTVAFRGTTNRAFSNTHASQSFALTVKRSSIWGTDAGNTAANRKFSVAFSDSIFGSSPTLLATGAITATNSFLRIGQSTLESLRVANPGIDSTCVSPWVVQTYGKTITDADLNVLIGTRNATYVSGDTLTVSFVDIITKARGIRVVDAYGAGLHYDGRLVAVNSTGTNGVIQVDPPPTAPFTSKSLKYKTFNKQIWPVAADSCLISVDGLSLTTTAPERYAAGQWISVGNIRSSRAPFGPRKIIGVAGNVLTLDRACIWTVGANSAAPYGVSTMPLPTVSVTFEHAYNRGTTSALVNKAEGGTLTIGEAVSTATLATDLVAVNWYGADGGTLTRGQLRYDEGYINAGIPLLTGDVLAVTTDAYILGLDVQWSTERALTGRLEPLTTTEPARLRMGAVSAFLP